jgi:hypothetical protein
MSIKVLAADDNDVMRGAIVNLLNEEPGTELVGRQRGLLKLFNLLTY